MNRELMQQALDALKLVYEQADFSNGVTDPTGTMDEGKVVIGGIVSDAIEALKKELAKPEQVIVPFPSFMRKRVEQAIDNSINPKGMSTHDSKAKVLISDLKLMLLIADLAAQQLAKPEQEAYGYAKRLAKFIWEKHYKEESPNWTPLQDVLGVLTQIDNMFCGLEKTKHEMPTKIFAPNLEQIITAAGFYRREWVGLTDDEINDFDKKLRDNGDYCSLHFAWGISAKLKELNT